MSVYEGKSKRVYVKDDYIVVIEFKDDVTAMDGAVKAIAKDKGVMNAAVSAYLFNYLESRGIKTHFIDYDGYRCIIAKKLGIIPVEVIVRNYAYGSLLKRIPLYKPLQKLDPPLLEFHFKDDSIHDPLILPEDIIYTNLLKKNELDTVIEVSLKANDVLRELFTSKNLVLVDIKFEFGKDKNGNILLADEISGDTLRVLDENRNHLDKEIFRKTKDVELLIKAYRELCNRLGIEMKSIAAYG
uniref:Phosphoribosylaminoimidazole-succinocarboxamide synthase n=1 Tax=Ignisphaera aggregans TaxID=334771 RepID=A0A7J3MYW6_9CREN